MTPVTLYQSTDTDAPQLANAQGSLKTLLKACLITGYGESSRWAGRCRLRKTTRVCVQNTAIPTG